LLAVLSSDSLLSERRTDCPCEIGQFFHILECQSHGVLPHQEKPVASPGYVATHASIPGNVNRDIGGMAITRDIVDRNLAVAVKQSGHLSDRSFHAMLSRSDAAHEMEGPDQTDRAMPAHPQIAHIVKEDHPGSACGVHRIAQQGAHHDVRAARFVDYRGPEPVVLIPEAPEPLVQRTMTYSGPAPNDQPSGFAARVGVDDLHSW